MKFSKFIIRIIMIWFTAAIVVTSASAQEVSSRLTPPKDDFSFESDTVINPLKPADIEMDLKMSPTQLPYIPMPRIRLLNGH